MRFGQAKAWRRLTAGSTPAVLAALAVRLWAAWVHAEHVPHYILASMPWFYEPGSIARSLAMGRGFANPFRLAPTGPTAWFAPVYPLTAAGLLKIFGVDSFAAWWACVALNAVCSALVCMPLYAVTRRIASRGLAVGAVWGWVVYPNAIIVAYEWVWDTSVSALLGATLLWATVAIDGLRASDDARRTRHWLAYGLLWGAALMTNPSFVSLLPFLAAWLLWRRRQPTVWPGRHWLREPALALAVMIACCLPWTIRNYTVFHRFVPLRSVLGLELWLGNNDQYVNQFPGWLHPMEDKAERQQYVHMGEIDYMRAKQRAAVAWMWHHPGRFVRISLGRAVAFWTGLANPIGGFRQTSSAMARLLLLTNTLLGIGAFAGIAVLWRRRSAYAVPAAAFVVVYPAIYYLTQALLRYRIPIDAAVVLLTAVWISTWRRLFPGPA